MIITGKNAVTEALKSDATAEKLYIQKGEFNGVVKNIAAMAKEKKVVVTYVDKTVLDRLAPDGKHQGVALFQTAFVYSEIEDILALAKSRDEAPFIVILDDLEDPHNLGSIIRTAECAGAHGIVIGKRHGVTVNDTVIKCSAGAAEHVLIAKVTNINDTIKYLKEQNVYVYAADMDGKPIYSANLKGAIAFVVGGEGNGVKRLTKELCDGVVSLPMSGKINSLNASVAAALTMYEKVRQEQK